MGKKSKGKIDGRTYRVTLDKFLANKELRRKSIAKDGSCLFRAVSEQVYVSQYYHHKVRLECVEYIGSHRDDFKEFITVSLDEYLAQLSKELWGGEVELVVLSRLYNRSIVVYNEVRKEVQEQVFLSPQDEEKCAVDKLDNPILLAYSDGNHYDSVYSTQYMDDTSFCQGLLYTILMEGVFKHHIPFNCKKKLTHLQEPDVNSIVKYQDRPSPAQNKDPEMKVLYNLSSHYEVEAVVGLSWTLYLNVALHAHRYEKESIEQKDRSMAASIQFHIGNKCYFHIDGKRMSGEIAALNVMPGMHSVHVHKNERWKIPVKDITLISSQSPANREQPPRTNTRTIPSGARQQKDRSGQQKDRSSPVPVTSTEVASSQSILGPPPVTVSSSPYGSVKKGKPAGTVQSLERNKRKQGIGNYSGGGGAAAAIEPTAQQDRKVKSANVKSVASSSPKTEGTQGAELPTALPTSSTTKNTPYSSVVKKTAGGPSGSLTSEGTEYDESSEEEAAQEESEAVYLPAHNQCKDSQHKSPKPLIAGQGDTTAVNPFPVEHSAQFQQMEGSLNVPGSHETTPIVSPKRQDEEDSPYLKRQIPQSNSSQPEDAWPQIHEDQKEVPLATCTSIPPPNTMLYAAVMTNRSNQDEARLPSSSSSSSSSSPGHTFHFPYSTTATDRAHFPFSNQHIAVAPRVTSPPLTMPQAMKTYLPTTTVPLCTTMGNRILPGLALNANLLKSVPGAHYPAGMTVTPNSHHFQSNQLPVLSISPGAVYGAAHVRHPSSHTAVSSEIYSSAPIDRASSSPMLGYNSSRPARMNESTTNNPLPYTTVAAAIEMRSMLGIHGGQSTNPVVYTESGRRNYQVSGYSPTSTVTPRPTTSDGFTQTPVQPAQLTRGVQVGPDTMTCGVQTDPKRSNAHTQTNGCYIHVEDLTPSGDVNMNSIVDQLRFAVQYSLHCLSVLSQGNSNSSVQDIEASMRKLLDNDQIERLVHQAARVGSLSVSQQDFLRSVGIPGEHQGTYGNSQPHTPQSANSPEFNDMSPGGRNVAEFGRHEDVTPQQEQHLQSPVLLPRVDVPPSYPLMMSRLPPPPPFMMPPPPHGNMPMYYPFMTHMPVPPMGYMPFMPQMVPHQVAPPQLNPEEVCMDEQHVNSKHAHHDSSVQGQAQQGDGELNSDLPQPLPLSTQVQSSEMVASPFPPTAMGQPNLSTSEAAVEDVDDQVGNTAHISPQQNATIKTHPAVTQLQLRLEESSPSNHTIPNTRSEHVESQEEQVPVDFHLKTSRKQQDHTVTQTTAAAGAPQSKVQKGQRSSQPDSNQPGLPCRPQPRSGQQQLRVVGGKQSHHGPKAKSVGKPKTGSNRASANLSKTDEKPATGTVEGKKETPSKRRVNGYSYNRARNSKRFTPAADHTGSSTVTGTTTSTGKSDQDPSRSIAHAYHPRARSNSSSSLGAVQGFSWSIPSPCSNIDYYSHNLTPTGDTEETEWPDFSKMNTGSRPVPACAVHVHSASTLLRLTGNPTTENTNPKVEVGSERDSLYRVEDDGLQHFADTETVDDPFSAVPLRELWNSDVGDYPLTLSPSQSQSIFQCTSDLKQIARKMTNLH